MNIVAEIGINHNGDIEIAKELIDIAKNAGCTYAKIQKREPDICVPDDQKNILKETLWGVMTYLEYKKKIEFTESQFKELVEYATTKNIGFFASVWDIPSVNLASKYTNIGKIPSALITDLELCKYARYKFEVLIVSTGMSTEEEVEACINACNPDVIMHTNSTYPCGPEDLNLNYIHHLKKYGKEVGYSGHEIGLATTFATVNMGVTWIERHVTLSKQLWGSDHKASIEPKDLDELVKGIRDIEKAVQYASGPRILFEKENAKRKTLRKC